MKSPCTALSRRRLLASAGLLSFARALSAQNAGDAVAKPAHSGPVIRIGNIGCGGRGTFVSDIIKENPGFKLVAAADYFEDRVNKFGEAHGIAADMRFTGLDGYKKMLEHVDAIAIHSPP